MDQTTATEFVARESAVSAGGGVRPSASTARELPHVAARAPIRRAACALIAPRERWRDNPPTTGSQRPIQSKLLSMDPSALRCQKELKILHVPPDTGERDSGRGRVAEAAEASGWAALEGRTTGS